MSDLISGKEALIALANGENVQKRSQEWRDDFWMDITDTEPFNLTCFLNGVNRNHEKIEFRLKPKTITINGIEVPAPFEPEDDEVFYHIFPTLEKGYGWCYGQDESMKQFGAWRTEEQIKQVVAALRSIFKGE